MFKKSRRVDAARAADMIESGAVVVDVRTKKEWDAGHIDGAVNMPMTKFNAKTLDGSKPIIVVCRSGGRSKSALGQFRGAELDAVDLKGGLHAWVRSGNPLRDRRGRPGSVA